MATFRKLEDIEVWQLSRQLAIEIHSICNRKVYSGDFGLKQQMLNSSGSIMDNIAEGFGRRGNKEFINFLMYSGGSASELKSQLYRSFDKNFISEDEFENLKSRTEKITTKLFNLATSIQKSEFKGQRYNLTSEPFEEYVGSIYSIQQE